MKGSFIIAVVIMIVAVLGISGCASQATLPPDTPTPVPPTPVPPTPEPTADLLTTTVLDMVERTNAGDFAGAADLFSEDALIYLVGMPPTGMEIYRGKDQFRTFLEECCTGQNFVWEVAPEGVDYGSVFVEAKTWMDFTRQLGVAPNSFHEIFVVKDGKITLYYSTMTEEALNKFKPILFEAIPELAAAVEPQFDPNETPASEIAVTISDATCTYDGPMSIQEGELTVNVSVQDDRFEKYAVTFFTVDDDKDLIDLMASTYNPEPPSWSNMLFIEELTPGENQTYTNINVEDGLLYLVCWASPPDMPIGNAGPFIVK